MNKVQSWANSVITEVEKVFLGKRPVLEKVLVAMLCRGHVLIEDVPGLGKTILARSLSAALGGKFARIQCTPDLLPADILGVSVYQPKEGTFRFRKGPIMANVVLVDEINRATPRSQSALLEAMGENQISIEGHRLPLPDPFFLLATENPVEFDGTFPLPEAQKDRFFLSLHVGYPDREVEHQVILAQRRRTHPVEDLRPVGSIEDIIELQNEVVQITVDDLVVKYILDIIEATRNDAGIRVGVSPRGSLALYKSAQALASLRGRDYVIPEDVSELVVPVLEKRVIPSTDSRIKGVTAIQLIEAILERIEVPVSRD
ncbi:MAG: AAA family ATPase [Spirochaeta sp.]